MGDTESKTSGQDQPGPIRRAGQAVTHLPGILFPSLPTPMQVVSVILAAATVVAIAVAWYGINVENGIGLALFTSIILTGFTVAAASLPRVVYLWLRRNRWFPGSDGFAIVLSVTASHVLLLALVISNQFIAQVHHRAYNGVATAGLIGAVLWIGHEALKAKKEYDLLREDPE